MTIIITVSPSLFRQKEVDAHFSTAYESLFHSKVTESQELTKKLPTSRQHAVWLNSSPTFNSGDKKGREEHPGSKKMFDPLLGAGALALSGLAHTPTFSAST